MTHMGTQTIETERLVLRRFTPGDAGAMFTNWASSSAVTQFLMWPPHETIGTTQEILRQWVNGYEKDSSYQWAMVPKDLGEPIGSIGIVRQDDDALAMHVGYCIGEKWWHRGYTSEALAAVVDFLFEKVGVNRVDSRHDSRNPNSGAVMKKCGLVYEGTLRQSDHNNQGICDACYYAILREEWEKKR